MRGGRIVDLGGGHGLLAHVLLLLDDTSPTAIVVDRTLPASGTRLHTALVTEWPRLADRLRFLELDLDDVPSTADDLVVSSHACGALTDRVLDRAIAARARVAVLPCCHHAAVSDPGDLGGWVDQALAIDIMRAVRLRLAGYHVKTQQIPETVTPKNRLLLGFPIERSTRDREIARSRDREIARSRDH